MKGKTLFVSDMDGTLLNADGKVSAATAAILNRLINDDGVLFTVATARTPATVVPLLRDVEISIPMIVMTGAAMWDNLKREYVDLREISISSLDPILDICAEVGVNPFVYHKDSNDLSVFHSPDITQAEAQFIEERNKSPFKHFQLTETCPEREPLLIFATSEYDRLKLAYEKIVATVDCEAVCYHDIYNEGMGYLEIFSKGTTKADAVVRLAKKIGADRVVAFGDNRNDIPMLEAADLGVAVGNAFPEVKEVAGIVIGNNTDDSVAHWIDENHNLIFTE